MVGAVVGLAAISIVPRLDPLAAAALSLAVAYGGYALAQYIFGFSGVASGLVLGGLAPSRASEEVREIWHELWESIDYIANPLLTPAALSGSWAL